MVEPTETSKGYFLYFDYAVVLTAIVCNIIILVAVVRAQFNLSGYRRLLISLAASDLYVCCVNVLTMIYQFYSSHGPHSSSTTTLCVAKVLRTLQLAGFFASLLNIVGMSVDLFIGLVYSMRYDKLMSSHLARFAIAGIWGLSFFLAFLDIPINVILYNELELSPAHQSGSSGNASAAVGAPADTQPKERSRLKRDMWLDNMTDLSSNGLSANSSNSFYANYYMGNYSYDDPSSLNIFDVFFQNLKAYDELLRNSSGNASARSNKSTISLDDILLILRDDERKIIDQADICTFFSLSKMWFEMCVISLALLTVCFLIVCYSVILKHVSQRMDAGQKSTRKLVFTTVILLSAFVICWLPFMLFEFGMLIHFQTKPKTESEESENVLARSFFLHNVLSSMLMCYPLVDPIIYAARIPAVQQSILLHVARVFPCCSLFLFRFLNGTNKRSLSSRRPHLAYMLSLSTNVDNPAGSLGRAHTNDNFTKAFYRLKRRFAGETHRNRAVARSSATPASTSAVGRASPKLGLTDTNLRNGTVRTKVDSHPYELAEEDAEDRAFMT